MIPIPEERLEEKLKTLLEEHLPETLLQIQKEQDDEVRCEAPRDYIRGHEYIETENFPLALITVKKAEITDKERILRQEAYTLFLSITFGGRDPARRAYRYAAAATHVIDTYPTLYGACRRAAVREKEYRLPRLPGDGQPAAVKLTIRAVTERL